MFVTLKTFVCYFLFWMTLANESLKRTCVCVWFKNLLAWVYVWVYECKIGKCIRFYCKCFDRNKTRSSIILFFFYSNAYCSLSFSLYLNSFCFVTMVQLLLLIVVYFCSNHVPTRLNVCILYIFCKCDNLIKPLRLHALFCNE